MTVHLPKGETFAGYVLGDVLGQGGFGITYQSRNRETGERFAIKEYFPADYADRGPKNAVTPTSEGQQLFHMGLEAFLQEANLLRDLPQQRGLMRVRAAFRKHGTAYCVMEYIHGDPLDRMMTRMVEARGAVPEDLVKTFLQSMLGALDAVHKVGVVHRDMKPANVMIRKDGQPILIDFGAARLMGKSSGLASMFTRKYAAIEQFPPEKTGLAGGVHEGPWSDLFALSVILYEMVSQSLPPNAEERWRDKRATGRDPYVPVRQNLNRNRVQAQYDDVLLNAIDIGCKLLPRDRIRTARDYARIAGIDLSAPAEKTEKPDPRPVRKSDNRKPPRKRGRSAGRKASVLVLVVILVVALVVIAYGTLM
ncbi:serine/threonine-protein kinase [uncultured Ruegeria sp.]|uniref:serine/threonine protein kinase n=1 Tax=uncultured Ruegeria sp. TaxID=259304 RepID=UPI00260E7067|nr:serine/threonine-protein kinase [uncultured Ruegeria sp.]